MKYGDRLICPCTGSCFIYANMPSTPQVLDPIERREDGTYHCKYISDLDLIPLDVFKKIGSNHDFPECALIVMLNNTLNIQQSLRGSKSE